MAKVVRVYVTKPQEGAVIALLGKASLDTHTLFFRSNQRLAENWAKVPIRLEWDDVDRGGRRRIDVDIPGGYCGSLIVSEKARGLIDDAFGEWVEFLPLECEQKPLWVMHVLPSCTAVDTARSSPIYKDYDLTTFKPLGPQIGVTQPYAFVDANVASLPVFRDENWRLGWFMTEPFVQYMRALDLTGFDARLMYDSSVHAKGFDDAGQPVA